MTLLGDAERDALAELLGRHYVDGRLEADALQARVETVYRAQSREEAQAGWRPTPERFRDPTTERVMRVWIDPADGSRHYVAEGP